ncbi:cysteine-trna ligase [Plasmopara halstedii]|uniref:cysteine--tRNA ligase n=1 Tax=Plasmopara halstedii TaxID=4781 RepID=A0A0P1A768_PLAHL|nr:cysteine-trna ligase [Plasmopara halstedii]CEG36466.1 cysteine-trna ligase [Plasmopara halstedii]|eukprot:XP_024572835.1 cysteine-trna ligase [Plasmopara halstedii]
MFNSLSGKYESLPRETATMSNVLKWYACGPTVYDRAHLGHARAYVSQDIMRRVVERTGGYKVQLVMGVTDVDDKIITRAKELNMNFEMLAREQEHQFFEDMTRLYVKPPTVITRVSEHILEIVEYIKEILNRGFAYEAVDGVYFSTQELGHEYGKLDPQRQPVLYDSVPMNAQGDRVEDDEKVKRDPRDFALWKAAKEPDEPAWPSPWGMGRPGWHIECSAMTHHVLGTTLDVHTGGVDLRFPHHNNEIAQCEAHNFGQLSEQDRPWCKHFVHFGHLHIRGRKMSKSLKNFISVHDFLTNGHTADQFRVFCLQFKYRANLMYSEDRIRDAEAVVERIRGFFQAVVAYGERSQHDVDTQWVDEALLDDLDTPRALALILNLISHGNAYLLAQREDLEAPDEVLLSLVDYILEMLDLFGLDGLYAEFSNLIRSRFATYRRTIMSQEDRGSSYEHESILRSLVAFRASVRQEALQDPKHPSNARILALCDALRNEELPRSGVQIEDLAPGRSVYKLLSHSKRQDCQAESIDKSFHIKQQEFEHLMKIAPADFFKLSPEFTDRFFTFDEKGFPTHENELPLTKTQIKKLAKKLKKHEKSHNQIERFDEISNISSFSAIPLRYNLQTYKVKGYVAPGVKGTAKNLQKRDYISFS